MKSSMKFILLSVLFSLPYLASGQSVSINANGNPPDPSAILDIQSFEKGLLIPRHTSAQRLAIPSPATGLIVYDTETRSLWTYTGSTWINVSIHKFISDGDGDTKVQVEESADEDIIRFDAGGTEVMKLSTNPNGAVHLQLMDGGRSTILGMQAGVNNTSSLGISGDENSFFGYSAGFANTTGRFNTFLGSQAGHNNSSGQQNTAIGFLSLRSNTIGDQNTASGVQSLYTSTTGSLNTAHGFQALYANTTGDQNTGIGTQALSANTTGNENTAIGASALNANTTGIRNTATGYKAMFLNMEGFQNSAHGSMALYFNNAGIRNTANGFEALYSNTNGNNNTATGYQALYSNTIGSPNTANGYQALRFNTTGTSNTAMGYRSLHDNTTGQSNTAGGHEALYNNTVAHFNTGFGYRSLYFISNQNYNTAVGTYAGDNFSFDASTFLGAGAYPNANGYTNCMGLGYNARPTASNQVRIGNTQVTSIGGYADWTNFSDGRFKVDLKEDIPGLAFINQLRPVTYQLDIHSLDQVLNEERSGEIPDQLVLDTVVLNPNPGRNAEASIRYSGFIAQEVEAAAQAVGYSFSGVDSPDHENDFYGLRYASFVVPLVKAVQEMHVKFTSEIDELKSENESLLRRLEALEDILGQK